MVSQESKQTHEQGMDNMGQEEGKKKSFKDRVLNSISIKTLAAIGIIGTLLLQNSTNYFIEKKYPKVHFKMVDSELSNYPKVHLLSDAENTYTTATLDNKLPFDITLENDNHSPIYIEDISLVVDRYEKIPRDSFLLIKGYFSQGPAPVTFLSTSKKINGSDKHYSFSVMYSETGETVDDKYLLIDAGYTDKYSPNIEFDDEGLYSFHFEVNYRIHGESHSEKTEKMRIMNITGEEYSLDNPQNQELKNQIVHSDIKMGYTIYGDGTIVLKNPEHTDLLYNYFSYLIKRVKIEEGTEVVSENHTMVLGENATEIHLPNSISTIDDGAFDVASLFEFKEDEKGRFLRSYYPKTIIYDGTYDEWRDNVKIGNFNNGLYQYE